MMKMKIIISIIVVISTTLGSLQADESARSKDQNQTKKIEIKEENVETTHSVLINGIQVNYKATAGVIVLKDEHENGKANVFFIAYTREDRDTNKNRPVTFCFNGGPGAASVWLQLGALGPKRIFLPEPLTAQPPYHLVDNEFSLLDETDLVFIDPVSTGYSRASTVEEAKQYHEVEEDIKSVAEFIRIYTTRNDRWDSPKFLAGESYGTTRAAGLASYLFDQYNMNLNGIILISSVLNFITLNTSQGNNDLPFILYIPSYTAAAWYHKKLSPELQRDLGNALRESENFAQTEYTLALMQGDNLSKEEREKISKKVSFLTGLKPQYVEQNDLRVPIQRFAQELLRDQRLCIGRFDSRVLGIQQDTCASSISNDPSADKVFGIFTATFNHYVREELKWLEDIEYRVLADVSPWNYAKSASNQYLNVADNLRDVMTRNPGFRVFVASGYFDLATPYYATNYTFSHLGLAPQLRLNVTLKYYDAGHMMFLHLPSLKKLRGDLGVFMNDTLKQTKNF
jgi:carboxypeptidase C (cathepsin A)